MTDFDQKARSWDDDPAKRERADAVAQGIRATIPLRSEMRALEYGCGTGLLSFALRDDFKAITLADTSRGMLQVLAEKISDAGAAQMHPVLLADGADALVPSSFDILYSMMVLHHLPDTDASLRRFHELLAPGGPRPSDFPACASPRSSLWRATSATTRSS